VRAKGAESCVSGAQLDRELAQLLAASRVTPRALVLEGVATRDANTGTFSAHLRAIDARERVIGVRELTSTEPRCDQLTASILLVLSLMVEFGSRGELVAGSSQSRDAERIPALHAARSTQPVSPAPAAAAHFQVVPMAALSLAVGLNPALSVGPALSVHVHTPWWPVFALRAGYWPSGRINLNVSPGADSASMEFHTFAGDLSLCLPLVRNVSWWFASCWGAALAARDVRVRGLDARANSVRVWAGASAALKLAYAVSARWLVTLDADMLGFRQRDRYDYEDIAGQRHSVFRPAHFAGLFALGLGVRL
jgi:hypothetical protein